MCGPAVPLKLFPLSGSSSPFSLAQLPPPEVFPDALLEGPSPAPRRHPEDPDGVDPTPLE